jgi:hypothetical protein
MIFSLLKMFYNYFSEFNSEFNNIPKDTFRDSIVDYFSKKLIDPLPDLDNWFWQENF